VVVGAIVDDGHAVVGEVLFDAETIKNQDFSLDFFLRLNHNSLE